MIEAPNHLSDSIQFEFYDSQAGSFRILQEEGLCSKQDIVGDIFYSS